LIALAMGTAGCGGAANSDGTGSSSAPAGAGGKGDNIHLVFVTNSNADWWNAVEKGMQDGGKEFGVRVELKRNDKETNGQIKLLEDVLSMPDVQGVAVSVYEAKAPGIADMLRELKSQGKVVITIDSDIAPEQADLRRAYIGTNNVKAGEAAGRAAAVLRPDGGKVCVFVGTSSAANARERNEGFFQGAGPKFTQLEIFDDGGNFAKAADNVQNALTKYNDVGVLLGLWSYNAARIAEQAKAAPGVRPTKTNVVTFDLDELAVDHVAAGDIDATVCQNPYEMGFQGVKLLKALIRKDEKTVKEVVPDGSVRDTGVRVIVPKADSPVMKNKEKGDDVITIDEMKSWLASKGLKCS
jgi:ribose transport system substrate-binding protein